MGGHLVDDAPCVPDLEGDIIHIEQRLEELP